MQSSYIVNCTDKLILNRALIKDFGISRNCVLYAVPIEREENSFEFIVSYIPPYLWHNVYKIKLFLSDRIGTLMGACNLLSTGDIENEIKEGIINKNISKENTRANIISSWTSTFSGTSDVRWEAIIEMPEGYNVDNFNKSFKKLLKPNLKNNFINIDAMMQMALTSDVLRPLTYLKNIYSSKLKEIKRGEYYTLEVKDHVIEKSFPPNKRQDKKKAWGSFEFYEKIEDKFGGKVLFYVDTDQHFLKLDFMNIKFKNNLYNIEIKYQINGKNDITKHAYNTNDFGDVYIKILNTLKDLGWLLFSAHMLVYEKTRTYEKVKLKFIASNTLVKKIKEEVLEDEIRNKVIRIKNKKILDVEPKVYLHEALKYNCFLSTNARSKMDILNEKEADWKEMYLLQNEFLEKIYNHLHSMDFNVRNIVNPQSKIYPRDEAIELMDNSCLFVSFNFIRKDLSKRLIKGRAKPVERKENFDLTQWCIFEEAYSYAKKLPSIQLFQEGVCQPKYSATGAIQFSKDIPINDIFEKFETKLEIKIQSQEFLSLKKSNSGFNIQEEINDDQRFKEYYFGKRKKK